MVVDMEWDLSDLDWLDSDPWRKSNPYILSANGAKTRLEMK